jgi:hypothetical protein
MHLSCHEDTGHDRTYTVPTVPNKALEDAGNNKANCIHSNLVMLTAIHSNLVMLTAIHSNLVMLTAFTVTW